MDVPAVGNPANESGLSLAQKITTDIQNTEIRYGPEPAGVVRVSVC
jgi:hypothetical protein